MVVQQGSSLFKSGNLCIDSLDNLGRVHWSSEAIIAAPDRPSSARDLSRIYECTDSAS
jgi:hypothetical protein